MTARDLTLHYTPKNGIVIDIFSAWNVFGKNPSSTAAAIAKEARAVCAKWNAQFGNAQVRNECMHACMQFLTTYKVS